ncbi:hypothetical protein ACM66Z_02820 [Sulfurovum sp. ST-21]|uniref:Uncharacterized protein n=1 Tax=Sulfurovum indicum TaxID=2779528 RepID=A0A7M1S4T9_9BACT|nr:hypothetical protein [Sulfurovum indicum]QOR62423.1 hypothetical protein IMZ28_02805 [Sulfurovum indicum]
MKFLVSKDSASSTLLHTLMSAVVIALLFYLGLDLVLHAFVVGLDMETVSHTLYGYAESFEEPILLETLLLQVHIDLFITLFVLMILTSIYIRLFSKETRPKRIVRSLFIAGMFAPLLLLAAYFWGEFLIYGWLGAFVLWHLQAAYVAVMILKKLFFK